MNLVATSDDGVTLFETLELRGGRAVALERHLARLADSTRHFGATPDTDGWRGAVVEVAARWGASPGRLRLTVDASSGRTTAHAGPFLVRTDATDAVTAAAVHDESSATSGHKTAHSANQVAALRVAALAGASEALFANTRGELCEGATSNVVVVHGGRIATPPLESGCLAGVTRALVLEALAAHGVEVALEPIPMSVLSSADELWLLSTGRLLQPVRHLDGRLVGDGTAPVGDRMRELFVGHHGGALAP